MCNWGIFKDSKDSLYDSPIVVNKEIVILGVIIIFSP